MHEDFRCLRCGTCCKSLTPIILLSDVETWVNMGAWHIMSVIEVVDVTNSLRMLGLKSCFTLRRRKGACYFYRGGGCAIYDLRPAVCRLFPFAYSETGIAVHPWARDNCPAIKLQCELPLADELKELAEKIMRELLGLPFYSTIIEELISSTGRFHCKPGSLVLNKVSEILRRC